MNHNSPCAYWKYREATTFLRHKNTCKWYQVLNILNPQHLFRFRVDKADKLSLLAFPPKQYAKVKKKNKTKTFFLKTITYDHFTCVGIGCVKDKILSACIKANRVSLRLHAKSFMQHSKLFSTISNTTFMST